MYNISKQEQILLYIGGEGRVSKSQVIKAIMTSMNLIKCKNEVILLVLIEAVTNNISRNTIHIALNISITKKQKPQVSSHIKEL